MNTDNTKKNILLLAICAWGGISFIILCSEMPGWSLDSFYAAKFFACISLFVWSRFASWADRSGNLPDWFYPTKKQQQ